MSPVIQATGRRIVHNWVWLHLMLTSAYSGQPLPTHCSTKFTTVLRGSGDFSRHSPKDLDEKVAELHSQVAPKVLGIRGAHTFWLLSRRTSAHLPESPGSLEHKNPSWELIKWLLADSSRRAESSRTPAVSHGELGFASPARRPCIS